MPDYDRKLDTRVKIHLGGLIVKTGIHHMDPALLYGALLSVKKVLEDPTKGGETFSCLDSGRS